MKKESDKMFMGRSGGGMLRSNINDEKYMIFEEVTILQLAGYLAIIGGGVALFFMFPFGVIYYFNLCDKISNFGMLIIYLVELAVILFIYSIYKSYRKDLVVFRFRRKY